MYNSSKMKQVGILQPEHALDAVVVVSGLFLT